MNARALLTLVPTLILLAGCRGPLAPQEPLCARCAANWHAQGYRGQAPPARGVASRAQVASEMPRAGAHAHPVGPVAAVRGPLLSWDGGVVEEHREGDLRPATASPSGGPQSEAEGRGHILALHREVLAEREDLLAEVRRLGEALRRAELEARSLRDGGVAAGARVAALEAADRELRAQNQELARRLTTAQVRRLEAEKLLLETRIAWQRELEGRSAAGGERPDDAPADH